MGFEITDSSGSFLEAVFIVIAISVAIPVVIWFVVMVRTARSEVIGDTDHDIEA